MKRLFTLGLVILLMTSVGAFAQTATGNVYGKVADSSGAVLPGASVTISGDQGTRSTVSGADGSFRFLNIDPGEYSVTVSLQGFGAANRKLLVQTGQSATLSIPLTVGAQTETVEVVAESPLVDVKKRGTSANLSTQDLQSVPTARDPWAVMSQVAGVNLDRVNIAGNEAGQQSNVSGKGSTSTSGVWSLDGVLVTDQTSNSSPGYYDFEVFQEINVNTGGADVTQQTGGIGVNMVTKRGTNAFHGGVRYLVTDEKWQSSNLPAEVQNDARLKSSVGHCIPESGAGTARKNGDAIDNIKEYGFDLGGPVIKDKLWFYGSYGKQDIKVCRFSGTPDDTLLTNYSAKVNWQAGASTMVSGFWFLGSKEKFGRSPGGLGTLDDSFLWNQGGQYTEGGLPPGLLKLEVNHTFSPSFFMSAKAAYFDTGFGLVTRGTGKGFTYDYVANATIGTSYSFSPLLRPQKTVNLDGSYFFAGMGGNHELKFGFGYRNVTTDSTTHYSGMTGYYFGPGTGGGDNIALVPRDGQTVFDADYLSAYAGDVFTKDRFTMNFGLRFDAQKSKNLPSGAPASEFFPTRLPALNYPGSDTLIDFTDVSPRVGFSYALNETRKTVIRASAARYANYLANSVVAAVNPVAPSNLQYGWNDLNGDRIVQQPEVGSTLLSANNIDPLKPGAVGVSPNVIDKNLKNQHDFEAILGVDHELGANFAIGGALTYRKTTDLFNTTAATNPRLAAPCPTATNCAVIPASAYTPVPPVTRTAGGVTGTVQGYQPDVNLVNAGGNGRYITNRADYSRVYKGFEVTLNKRLANKWGGRVAFAYNDWTEQWGGTPTSATLNPTKLNTDALRDGGPVSLLSGGSGKASFYSSFTWSLYMNAIVQLPASFDLSTQIIGREGGTNPISISTARGRDGTTANALVGNVDDQRYDNLWNIDFRLARNSKIGSKVTLTPALELFNALNNDLVLSRARSLSSASYGRVEEVISPRVLRLSARLTF